MEKKPAAKKPTASKGASSPTKKPAAKSTASPTKKPTAKKEETKKETKDKKPLTKKEDPKKPSAAKKEEPHDKDKCKKEKEKNAKPDLSKDTSANKIVFKNEFKCVKTLNGHTDSIECMIMIDENRIVTSAQEGIIKLWNIQNLEELKKPIMIYKGHTDAVFSVLKFTEFKLVSCSRDKTIRIWNIETGQETACITGKEPYFIAKQISDAQVAVAGGDAEIRVFNLFNEEETTEEYLLSGHLKTIRCLEVFEPNIICSSGEDMFIMIWNFNERRHIGTLEGHTKNVSCLVRLRNGKLASGSYDSTIRIWDINKKECLSILDGQTDQIMSLAELPDGNLISGGSEWNIVTYGEDNKVTREVEGHQGSINAIVSYINGLVITASADQTIKFWK
ncbi:MAG: hypothetical protein MJ252_22550 [archaeon]|nr:hypothetical protein [archaeon]